MEQAEQQAIVIFVGSGTPAALANIEAHGIELHRADSIRALERLLEGSVEPVLLVSELAFADGNWRDLVEHVRARRLAVPIFLLAPTGTAELWWDALENGIEDILVEPRCSTQLHRTLAPFLPARDCGPLCFGA